MIPESRKSDKPVIFTGFDKVHLKGDCKKGSIVNGTRENIMYSFVLDKPAGHNIKKPRTKLFKKIIKSVLFHFTTYLEDDDYKPVDFNGESISFTCQLNKLKTNK